MIDHNIDVQSVFSWAPKVVRKCESKHCFSCGADGWSGGRSVCGHVITKFSGMGRFTLLWGCAHARALSSAIIVLDNETDTHKHLEMKECVKYLEVYVDADLSWKHHIEHISRKISKCVGVTAKLRHLIPPQTLLSIFQLLLSPYLTYGICAWGQGAKVHTNKLLIL